jgi:uncharacterized membrane protein HdeD (DUF308 family)
VALRGALAILFGLIALFLPGITLLSLVLVFAAYLLADGVLAIISAIRAARRNERWTLLAAEGAVNIIAGVLAALWPGITVVAFALLIGAWAIVSGSLMFAAAFRLNAEDGRVWLGLGGLLSLLFGVLLVLAPLVGAVVLTWWLGFFAIAFGVVLLALAYRLWSHRDDRVHVTVRRPA